jgi:predicted lipase
VVTGHSLGGSIAALCALDLVLSDVVSSNSLTLYTFGEPRVGNPAFAAAMDKFVPRSYRVVHSADLVPHVPPSDIIVAEYLHHS